MWNPFKKKQEEDAAAQPADGKPSKKSLLKSALSGKLIRSPR